MITGPAKVLNRIHRVERNVGVPFPFDEPRERSRKNESSWLPIPVAELTVTELVEVSKRSCNSKIILPSTGSGSGSGKLKLQVISSGR